VNQLGEICGLIGIVLAGVAFAIGFWDGIAPEFIGVPILLAGRYPGWRTAPR
jgi:uncharacterized membrane protein